MGTIESFVCKWQNEDMVRRWIYFLFFFLSNNTKELQMFENVREDRESV